MKSILFLLFFIPCHLLNAQDPVGIFDNSVDIGNPRIAGSASYDENTQSYTIKGGGSNIWFNRDEFHFLYKKLKGDFILTADFAFTGDTSGAVGHRKIGWMIRESADEGAASANACKHIDGLVVLQWRPYRGMYMRDPEEERFYPKKGGQTIQLSRIGRTITMKIAHPGEPLQLVGSYETETLGGEVLAGLYICAHDSNSLATARVWNVRIDKPVLHPWTSNPHAPRVRVKETPGSRLEVIDLAGNSRSVIRESKGPLEVPGWARDGRTLTGSPGRPSGGRPEYSPDKKYVYYNASISGTMQIWRMHPDGSGREQLTFDEYHNWFPHISPDGKWIAYISFPMDIDPEENPSYEDATLRIMPLTMPGAPRVIAYLCGGQATLNASSWSPDSKRLAFVSNSEIFQ